MSNPALKAQAEALGIEVGANWNDKRIQEEIEKVQGASVTNTGQASTTQLLASPEAKKGEKQAEVRLKFDYWSDEDVRQEAGSVITVPMSKAKQLIQHGKAEIPLED